MSEVTNMMLKDTKDLLDNIEITDIATQCKLLKDKEDEIAELEEKLKAKKAEADVISSEVIPELLKEQGLNEIKLADGSSVTIKTEYRATIPRDDFIGALLSDMTELCTSKKFGFQLVELLRCYAPGEDQSTAREECVTKKFG